MKINLDIAKKVTKNYRDYELLSQYMDFKAYAYEIEMDEPTLLELQGMGCNAEWLLLLCEEGLK